MLRSLIRAIEENPRLELQLVVTGMHLVREFGNSVAMIQRDGTKISARIPMYKTAGDVRANYPASLAREVDRLGSWLLKNKTDILVVLGDRLAVLGGALAALTANIPIAHLHGGEIATGDLDDRIRYAVSALASVHFVATDESRKRLLKAGEPPERIFVVGAFGLDEIFEARKSLGAKQQADFRRRWNLPLDKPVVVLVHHPCGYGTRQEYVYAGNILKILKDFDGLIIGPNNDPGHSGIRRAIRQYLADPEFRQHWRYVDNLARQEYLLAVTSADLLVGNSSSGIIEANALGTAVVNIGPRQSGRQRNGQAIFDCDYKPDRIRTAMNRAIQFSKTHKIRSDYRFGRGEAGRRTAAILSQIPLTRSTIIKPHV